MAITAATIDETDIAEILLADMRQVFYEAAESAASANRQI